MGKSQSLHSQLHGRRKICRIAVFRRLIDTLRLVQLGKFGSFPSKLLLGRHYDVTYEIYQSPNASLPEASSSSTKNASAAASFGQGKGKNRKKKGGKGDEDGGRGAGVMSNPGWKNALRPLRRQALLDAVVGKSPGLHLDNSVRWDPAE